MKKFMQISKKFQIERWEQVLRVLKNLSPHERRKHWDMHDWGTKTECGTIACAGGHCGLDPWFRRRGFQMNFYRDVFNKFGKFFIEGKNGSQFDNDVEKFFGLEGADTIFYNNKRRSVGVVIKEVKANIKKLKTIGYSHDYIFWEWE